MTDFRINVVIDPSNAVSGSRRTETALTRLERRGNSVRNTLQNAFAVIGVVSLVRQVTNLADSFVNAQNRLKLVTKDTDQLNAVMEQLFLISDRTRSSFDATATIYSRTALSVKQLGLSQQETLNFVESLNKAIILSGVNSREASNGLIQLSQGLASGAIRGDELRSVLEQLPAVADVIGDHFEAFRGELRVLGEQGKITAKGVLEAFVKATDELSENFDKTTATIGQATNILVNNIIRMIGELNRSTGVVSKVAAAIILLAKNLDTLAKIAVVAGTAISVGLVKRGILLAVAAVRLLTLAIAANPIGALVIAVLAGAQAINQFGDEISFLGDDLLTLKDVALGTFQFLVDAIQPVKEAIVKGFQTAINSVIDAFNTLNVSFNDILSFATSFINSFIGLHVGMGKALSSIFSDIKLIILDVIGESLLGDLADGIDTIIAGSKKGLDILKDVSQGIARDLGLVAESVGETLSNFELPEADASFVSNLIKVGQNASDAFQEGFNQDFVGGLVAIVAPELQKVQDQIQENATTIAKKRIAAANALKPSGDLDEKAATSTRLPLALRQQLALLEKEANILKLSNRERTIQTTLLKSIEKLRSANVTLTEPQRELLENAIRRNAALKEQAEVLSELNGPYEEIVVKQEVLGELYKQGSIDLQLYNDQMIQLVTNQAALNIEMGGATFSDGFIVGIENMLESVRNFGSESGAIFANFFEQSSEGFADAIADSIVFGDSLSEGIGNAAREALADLLSGFIKLGIQYVLNASIANTLGATATTLGVAQASTLAAAWATPAAMASLATSGANAAPASAGIASTVALSEGLALAGFADGGFVSGAGGPREDTIPAKLSHGEFVVNARSTSRFRPQLEAMNNNRAFADGGMVGKETGASSSPAANTNVQSGNKTNIINVLDPALVGDYLATPDGEDVLINVIKRNSSGIKNALS